MYQYVKAILSDNDSSRFFHRGETATKDPLGFPSVGSRTGRKHMPGWQETYAWAQFGSHAVEKLLDGGHEKIERASLLLTFLYFVLDTYIFFG